MRTKIYSLILMVLFTLSAATAWSRNVTIKTDTETGESYINLPTTGLDVLTIPDDVMEFKIYSDGGKNGSYSYNAVKVIFSPNAAWVLSICAVPPVTELVTETVCSGN